MEAKDFIRGTLKLGNVSQRELSRKMGRSPNYISAYLASRKVPSIELAVEIADAANCDILVVSRDSGIDEQIELPDE